MKIEQELENGQAERKQMPEASFSHDNIGFDFSTPSGSNEGFNFTSKNFTPGTAGSGEGYNINPFVFGSYNQHDSPGILCLRRNNFAHFISNIVAFRKRSIHTRENRRFSKIFQTSYEGASRSREGTRGRREIQCLAKMVARRRQEPRRQERIPRKVSEVTIDLRFSIL